MRKIYAFLPIFLLINGAFAASCPSGYGDVSADYASTFYSRDSGTCPAGYEPYSAPTMLSFSFDGLILDSAPTLCGAGYHYVDGDCVAYTNGNCQSNFFQDSENEDTFYSRDGNVCPAGYEPYSHGSNLTFLFNGLILGSAPTVCASGHYVNGTCEPYSSTGCITGYVDAGVDNIVAAVDANGDCPSNYDSLWTYQSCTPSTSERLCSTICNGGMMHTGTGNCAAPCSLDRSGLYTSTGLIFPLWDTRTTQPAIYIGLENGVCYVNLAPGVANNAVNVEYNGAIYHTTY